MRENNRWTAEQKLEALQFAERYTVKSAAKHFECTEQTIYRWKRVYDGTLQSLQDGSSVPKTPHPTSLTKAEIEQITMLLDINPYILDREIAKLLGTNRHPLTIRKYREKLMGKRCGEHKYDNSTMFHTESVDQLNNADIYLNKWDLPFYLVEINNCGIFVGKETNKNPAYFTPYYSMALRFSTKEDANGFIAILKNTSCWKLSVKEVTK